MKERLQKILSAAGVASRRQAETMMLAGRVTVGGVPVKPGDTADPETDDIRVDGAPLPTEPGKRYLMLNKPRGFVTTLSDEKGRKTVAELVQDCGDRVYPVGRLDCDSEGLLLLTNDGALANRLMHPGSETEKRYEVTVRGWREGADDLLRRPVELDGRRICPPEIAVRAVSGEEAQVEIVIHEGRNRQVRRMCELAGLHVTRLRRTAEGPLRLGRLKPGTWRELTKEELRALGVR